jgi:hypothetical protein
MLATTTGELEEANAHFTAATVSHERIAAPTWLARTRLEWARMLLPRRAPGDVERAGELLDQVGATARQLGLDRLLRRATALWQECPDTTDADRRL